MKLLNRYLVKHLITIFIYFFRLYSCMQHLVEQREDEYTEQVVKYFESKGFEVKRGIRKGRKIGTVVPDLILNNQIAVEIKFVIEGYYWTRPLITGVGQCLYYLLEYPEAYLVANSEEVMSHFKCTAIKNMVPNLHFWVITAEDGKEVSDRPHVLYKTFEERLLAVMEKDLYYAKDELQQLLPESNKKVIGMTLSTLQHEKVIESRVCEIDKKRVRYWGIL